MRGTYWPLAEAREALAGYVARAQTSRGRPLPSAAQLRRLAARRGRDTEPKEDGR